MPITLHSSAVTTDVSNTAVVEAACATYAGLLLVVGVRLGNPTAVVSTLIDTAGHAYTKAVAFASGAREAGIELWFARNTVQNRDNTIRATLSAGSTYNAIGALNYELAERPAPLDVTASSGAPVTADTVRTTPFTTFAGRGLIVAVADVTSTQGTWIPGDGYTKRLEHQEHFFMMQDRTFEASLVNTDASASTPPLVGTKAIIAASFKMHVVPPAVRAVILMKQRNVWK